MNRLQNDTAVALAHATLDIVRNCIRPEEWKDAFESFVHANLAALESYEIMKQRQEQRLNPSVN